MTWTPITSLPAEREVVEIKDEINYPNIVLLLYYDHVSKNWIGGTPKSFKPTHWRKKEGK